MTSREDSPPKIKQKFNFIFFQNAICIIRLSNIWSSHTSRTLTLKDLEILPHCNEKFFNYYLFFWLQCISAYFASFPSYPHNRNQIFCWKATLQRRRLISTPGTHRGLVSHMIDSRLTSNLSPPISNEPWVFTRTTEKYMLSCPWNYYTQDYPWCCLSFHYHHRREAWERQQRRGVEREKDRG